MHPRVWEFRALKNSKFSFMVISRGAVAVSRGSSAFVGADSVIEPGQFAPGDMPEFPQTPVRAGDSWSLKTQAGSTQGQATYELIRVEPSGEQRICHIRGENVMDATPVEAHMEPIVSTSRFDADAGQFLDEEYNYQLRFEIAPGEEVSVTTNATRQFFPPEERVADVANTGDYVLMFDDNGKPHARTLAGVNADDTSESMDKVLAVHIHHGWTDTNNDGAPVPDELSDRTTQFDAGVQELKAALPDCKIER